MPAAHQLQREGRGHRLDTEQQQQHEKLHRARLNRRRAAEEHPDERPGQRHQPDGAGLVDRRHQCLRPGRPGDLHRRVARQETERERGLHLTFARGQLVECPPAGQRGGGHRAADEDAGHRDHGDPGEWDDAAEDEAGRHGQRGQRDRQNRPPTAAVGRHPARGGPARDSHHEQHERRAREDRPDDRPDQQRHRSELRGRPGRGHHRHPLRPQPDPVPDGGREQHRPDTRHPQARPEHHVRRSHAGIVARPGPGRAFDNE